MSAIIIAIIVILIFNALESENNSLHDRIDSLENPRDHYEVATAYKNPTISTEIG